MHLLYALGQILNDPEIITKISRVVEVYLTMLDGVNPRKVYQIVNILGMEKFNNGWNVCLKNLFTIDCLLNKVDIKVPAEKTYRLVLLARFLLKVNFSMDNLAAIRIHLQSKCSFLKIIDVSQNILSSNIKLAKNGLLFAYDVTMEQAVKLVMDRYELSSNGKAIKSLCCQLMDFIQMEKNTICGYCNLDEQVIGKEEYNTMKAMLHDRRYKIHTVKFELIGEINNNLKNHFPDMFVRCLNDSIDVILLDRETKFMIEIPATRNKYMNTADFGAIFLLKKLAVKYAARMSKKDESAIIQSMGN